MIEDGKKNRYLLKFDPSDYPELCSAADVIGSKFFYALGYFTPENYVVRFHREDLTIPRGATWRDASGRRHALTAEVVDRMLRLQPKSAAGTYRAMASRLVEGRVVGPFSYRGSRSDDPNDTIPHQDRRVLRGLRVFAAWLNHHDTRSINSMDTLVGPEGSQYLKHYLIDFGSILGSAGYAAKEPWMGNEFTIARREAAKQLVTLGFYLPRWMRSNYPKFTGVGLFDAWSFDPVSWKSNYPNPAFLNMDRMDAFWAAKQVAAFTDEEIRAIVKTGEYSDPRAAAWVADCLIQRRDKTVAAWFGNVLPLDNFRVAEGSLRFDDLSAKYRVGKIRNYDVRWAGYDNERNATEPLAARGPKVPVENTTEYLAAAISCSNSVEDGCTNSLTVYLRRGREVVGIDR